MTPDEIDTMARTVWGESRGESLPGKIAVAWVIRNRADHPGWWGKGIGDVCKTPWQFSCWNPDDPNRLKLLSVSGKDEMFRECLMVCAGVLTGNFPDPTNGSNHYHAKGVSPKWAAGKQPNGKIGAHLFYKL